VAIQDNLIDGPVVVVEPSQRSNCPVHHGPIEPRRGSRHNTLSKGLHLLLHICGIPLESLQEVPVLEAYYASSMPL
jgi:hypothetical protein